MLFGLIHTRPYINQSGQPTSASSGICFDANDPRELFDKLANHLPKWILPHPTSLQVCMTPGPVVAFFEGHYPRDPYCWVDLLESEIAPKDFEQLDAFAGKAFEEVEKIALTSS